MGTNGINGLSTKAAAEIIARALDAQDGGDNKISAAVWNAFVADKGGKTINNSITLDRAIVSISAYINRNAKASGVATTDVSNQWFNDMGLQISNNSSAANPPEATPEPEKVGKYKQARRNIRAEGEAERAAINSEYEQQVNGKLSDRNEKYKKEVHAKVNNEKAKGKKFAKKVNEGFQNAKPGGEKQGKDMTFGELAGTAFVEANRRGARGVYEHGKMLANQAADAYEGVAGAAADASAYVNKKVVQPAEKYVKTKYSKVKQGVKIFINKASAVISSATENAKNA